MKTKLILFMLGFFLLLVKAPLLSAPNEKSVPVDSTPRWLKGNLHTHSLWSDGDDYPEMIVDWYVTHGYQFLALSDHNTLGQGEKWFKVDDANKRAKTDTFTLYYDRFGDWVETRRKDGVKEVRLKPLSEFRTLFEKPGDFLLIQGEEITDKFGSKPIHMNASNLLEYIKPQGGSTVTEVMSNNLAAVEEQKIRLGRPILTHLNHPNFGYGITAEELAMVTREQFFEVYNGHPAVNHRGDATHVGVERMWDIINTLRIAEMKSAPVFGLATDDSHNYFNKAASSPGRGWVMVRAAYLTPDSIIKGLELGDFYASSGIGLSRLEYVEADRRLEIEVMPQAARNSRLSSSAP